MAMEDKKFKKKKKKPTERWNGEFWFTPGIRISKTYASKC